MGMHYSARTRAPWSMIPAIAIAHREGCSSALNALIIPVLGISSPGTPHLPRVLLITTVLLISAVVAVVHPVTVQGLGQADREIATGKLPQGTHVPITGGSGKRLCRGKRGCSVLWGLNPAVFPPVHVPSANPQQRALLPVGLPDAQSRHFPTGRHSSMDRHSPCALPQPTHPALCPTTAHGCFRLPFCRAPSVRAIEVLSSRALFISILQLSLAEACLRSS